MNRNTVLVSGGNGYIALHLKKILKNNNYNIISATRDMTGDLQMDFSNPNEITALKVSGIDTMIHTVTPNEGLYKSDPYRALSENVMGIRAALHFCVNNNIRNFIYFSSFHVFGESEGKLVESTPISPRNDYGLAHSTAEQTVQMFDRTHRVNAWIIRPSNLFGVPESCEKFKRWNLIPFLFCKEAAEQHKITLMTPGTQLRNFVGVSDVCKKVMWVLEHRPVDRIVHAYGNETLSVLQYALLVQKIAIQEYGHLVDIIRPEGNDPVLEFEFTSQYHNMSELEPIEELSVFVRRMLKVLLFR
ncbi:NAD(P)-dependent oxidoreductase [Paenibacillus sp. UMB4589-SE434]|uniref:NAD-dependent epimerase/dehydratase family protein n=1 Tax=Paenibacillus sp. UMB4589-SE434 TaxID=3046314 RepID=UPI00254EBE89|nr:NAD(P)-dependent oxidoreductase [Paenibacillus sp. UMB4589-SE434]MDK8183531.1 NAD(P)-dependent oxidoreductase [Paenibacillus sp. UMB4589-SE434]